MTFPKMTNQIIVIVVTITICYFSSALGLEVPGEIYDLRVYRIESRLAAATNSTQVLTANPLNMKYADSNRTIVAITAPWIDDASQKWRMDKSAVYESFMLHPTFDENFELAYRYPGNYLSRVGSIGFGYNRLWYLEDAGEGHYLIRNHYNPVCLKAKELKTAVTAEKCENSVDQQWKITLLS